MVSYTSTIQEDKSAWLLKDRIDRPVISLSLCVENTSALVSRWSGESKRGTLLISLPCTNSFFQLSSGFEGEKKQ